MPNLSIIIPIYNAENYLSTCLNSIIEQSYTDFEVILVNDGSKDNSKSICKQYSAIDSRIIFFDKENEGVSLTRNFGISKAKGNYITFVDADDWLEKDTYKIIFDILENNKDIDLFIYNYNYCTSNKTKNKCAPETFCVEGEQVKELKATVLNPNYFTLVDCDTKFKGLSYPWNKVIKKSIVDKYNLDFKLTNRRAVYEDLLFIYEYLQYSNKVYFLNEPLYNYRVFEESSSNRYNEEILNVNNYLFNKLLEIDKDILKEDWLKQSFYVRIINNLYLSLNSYFYNKKNANKFKDKIKLVKKTLNKKIYYDAFNNVNFKLLSNNLKIVTILIKLKMFNLLYLYCKIIDFIKKI